MRGEIFRHEDVKKIAVPVDAWLNILLGSEEIDDLLQYAIHMYEMDCLEEIILVVGGTEASEEMDTLLVSPRELPENLVHSGWLDRIEEIFDAEANAGEDLSWSPATILLTPCSQMRLISTCSRSICSQILRSSTR